MIEHRTMGLLWYLGWSWGEGCRCCDTAAQLYRHPSQQTLHTLLLHRVSSILDYYICWGVVENTQLINLLFYMEMAMFCANWRKLLQIGSRYQRCQVATTKGRTKRWENELAHLQHVPANSLSELARLGTSTAEKVANSNMKRRWACESRICNTMFGKYKIYKNSQA